MITRVYAGPLETVCGMDSYLSDSAEKNSLEREERKQAGKEEGPRRLGVYWGGDRQLAEH